MTDQIMSIKSLVFSGSDYEIGFQQGQSNREAIHKGIEEVFSLDLVNQSKPKLLPKSLFVMLAKRRADKLLKKDLFSLYPKHAERIRGIAEGAEIDVSSLLFIQMLELVIGGCTSLGFLPSATSTGETILAKNFDYASFCEPYNLVCETQPSKGYKTLCCRFISLSGALDGMNEHGLAMTYNLARSIDKPECHVPTSVILQEMLETCKNAEEGADFLTKAKTGGHDGIITLADATGNIRVIEYSRQHAKVREPQSDVVINTNHYQTAEMKSVEVTPVYPNSPPRFERAKNLLEHERNIDEELIGAVLRDHGTENVPSDMTVCVHGDWFGTLRSMIMYPKKRLMKLLFGHPCQYEYQEVKFS